ncbi:UDP-N-acetylglucosamine--N-acetylmuramyl-(pentapeptide) pyrophosphoryl-undecaprenol N-acetylglucosamine transferase [Synoicihabitans lomoniglobus]|uniref:UDP-N-acetylglucosamine--N-acetylmuramyl-(pentapeptide) pyrophosphoryl-undecaprenol N-acetylglucosamine transferase n=1 Tax=Synoicihabitans lomoniglobus TaxID=2909285 RepID=A0AAF0CQF9_9BACT|nr:UDP-N-acetylglucosamine--N-acetylmuramyl-(pentapeptide) pyrophosphoryl-undecaprenol N-acetylglucosamine transferase [Opitutaceae bacterium LMO-M01]WED66157.1 UDP-N-acetylglucosamine--N-acetylmuramyl-(pentapeptide) pyrophosphoryl-undecaprenol N-acetylglucosamine transferase [Opitutaceae bacterium LMO-M01]
MSKFVIACGGTGGHLAPGVALAERLRDRGHETLLLISEKQIDRQLTAKYPNFRFSRIPGAPLIMTPTGLLGFALHQTRGLLFSIRLVRHERPDMIVGFGGFTTAAIIVAGWMMRVPVALHEANRVPGRAVRALARFARRVYLPREVTLEEVNHEKLRHAGLPVRQEIMRLPRPDGAEHFGLDPNKITVAVLGGSQGARALNTWAEKSAPLLAANGVQMLVVTGPGKSEGRVDAFKGPNGETIKSVSIPFCDRMAELFSASDLVVSRSGAGTIAELVACGVPAVLVPYPTAADNHQAANAAEFAHQGGGIMVEESDIDQLQGVVEQLVADEERRSELRANISRMNMASTLDLMFEDMENLASPPRHDSSSPTQLARS